MTNFRLFQTESMQTYNFKFDENDRKLSKQVENTVGKGEIAHYKQFLLFPQCFQKACFPGVSKGVIVWEWVKQPEGMKCCRIYLSMITKHCERFDNFTKKRKVENIFRK